MGLPDARTVWRMQSGRRVRYAGIVLNRQRPGTAKGVVFMTLEDETGLANVIVWPKLWKANRKLGRSAILLGIDGRLQRQGDAISVLAERFWELPEPAEFTIRARNFH